MPEFNNQISLTNLLEMKWRWRLPEFLGLGVGLAAILLALQCLSEYQQIIPLADLKGAYSYPVRLESEWCTATQFSICTVTSSVCCTKLDAGVQPAETVSTIVLWLIFLGLPCVVLFVREALRRGGWYCGVGTLADALLGLFYALGLCVVATDTIKRYAGQPRPNYAALRALVEFGGSTYSDLTSISIRSFPSGHASESMAGMAYVTLLCWADLTRHTYGGRQGWRRTLLSTLCLLPVVLGAWVGITRIRDYWHFQVDVLAGWVIGACSAAISMHWITSPVREKPSESADSTMACFNRNGALPLMSREIGGDNGSDIYGATANVEPESDASNLA